jgi:hypothetical protein
MVKVEADIQQCVEKLCQQGCERVYEYIDALRSGRQLDETGPLSPGERRQVLAELESIMAVYERSAR